MPVLKVKKNGIWEPVSTSTSVIPDYNQNDSTASDYIKNRPFYTGEGLVNTWTFDGNLDNVEHVADPTQPNSYFVKASDIYVEPDSLLGSSITYTDFDGDEFTSTLDTVQDMTDVIGVPVYVINGGLLCLPNDIPALSATAGIYAWYGVDRRYVSKIDANQSIFEGETVHKLDVKYLPEGGFGWTEEGKTNVWEYTGNVDDYKHYSIPEADDSYQLIKISDNYIEPENWVGAIGEIYNNGDIYHGEFTEDLIEDGSAEMGFTCYSILDMLFSTTEANPYLGAPSAGTYLIVTADYYVQKITVAKSIFEGETIHKIDPKYLPDDIGTVKTVNGFEADENGNVSIEIVNSWNDLTDKPFYEEEASLTTILSDTLDFSNYNYDNHGNVYELVDSIELRLIPDQDYIVNFDGTEYYCTAFAEISRTAENSYPVIALGNYALYPSYNNTAEDTKEPFVFLNKKGSIYLSGMSTNRGKHNIIISKVYNGIQPLDKKFLPRIKWNDLSDRPFYDDGYTYEKGEEIYSLSNNFEPYTLDGSVYIRGYSESSTLMFTEGKTYFVEYDGVIYELIAYDDTRDNQNVSLGGKEYNAPFFITTYVDSISTNVDTEGYHTIKVYDSIGTNHFKKLDKKYVEINWDNFEESPIDIKDYSYHRSWNGKLSTINPYVEMPSDNFLNFPPELLEKISVSLTYQWMGHNTSSFSDFNHVLTADVEITADYMGELSIYTDKLYNNIVEITDDYLFSTYIVITKQDNIIINGAKFEDAGIYFGLFRLESKENPDEYQSFFASNITIEDSIKFKSKYLINSDWRQNKIMEADYIKNRPFYETITNQMLTSSPYNVTTTKTEDSKLTSQKDITKAFSNQLVENNWYRVKFDKAEYFCKCTKAPGPFRVMYGESLYLGNMYMMYYNLWTDAETLGDFVQNQLAIYGVKDTSKEPFCLHLPSYSEGTVTLYTQDAGKHTISIQELDIKCIPNRFIAEETHNKIYSDYATIYYEYSPTIDYPEKVAFNNGYLVKISNSTPDREFFVGKYFYLDTASYRYFNNEGPTSHEVEFIISENEIKDAGTGFSVYDFLVFQEDGTIEGVNVSSGVWVLSENIFENERNAMRIGDGGKTISSSIIPRNIARLTDIPKVQTQVQADWEQTDETAPDFIKNKPDEADALALAAELGFVEPVAADDGSIYTDENGAVYTLI